MRKVLPLVFALALGACSTTGEQIDAQIKQVQDQTRVICAYVPTVATVAKIIATLVGGVGTVDLIGTAANGICSAVTNQPLAEGPGKRQAVYNGVVIHGTFVK